VIERDPFFLKQARKGSGHGEDRALRVDGEMQLFHRLAEGVLVHSRRNDTDH
jgi:hypothetical protein